MQRRTEAYRLATVFPVVPKAWAVWRSDGDLRADLDHPARGDLEEVGRVVGGARERDEQAVLPARDAGVGLGLERAPRQEERGRHDVEVQAALARNGERLGHVRGLHEAEPQR